MNISSWNKWVHAVKIFIWTSIMLRLKYGFNHIVSALDLLEVIQSQFLKYKLGFF